MFPIFRSANTGEPYAANASNLEARPDMINLLIRVRPSFERSQQLKKLGDPRWYIAPAVLRAIS
jgi:hypothetical protein